MNDPQVRPVELDNDDPMVRRGDSSRNLAVLVYILQALSFFMGGITGLVAVIVNYVKMDDVRETWVEPHFRWQIRTFWFGLLWCVIGFVTLPILVGWFILLGVSIWVIYRIVRGALALNDGKAP